MAFPVIISSGQALQALGLALMVGGMLALGAFVAPVLFKVFPRPDAGQAMTTIFLRFDTVLLIALALVLLGELMRFGFHVKALFPLTALGGIRLGVLTLLVGIMLYSTLITHGQMGKMVQTGKVFTGVSSTEDLTRFQALHKQSESLYKLQLLLAVALLLLTPFTHAGNRHTGSPHASASHAATHSRSAHAA